VALVVAELAVPFIAESRATTPWHPGHIAERYSLFTLIVLGESVLAGSVALGAGLDSGGLSAV
jgi:low temperature requirement protein LtrA